jgi:hypothetical protein
VFSIAESQTETKTTYPPRGCTSRRPALDRALAPCAPPAPTVDTTDEGGAQVEGARAEAVATAAAARATDAVPFAARFRILARFGIPPAPPVNMHMVSLGIFALALHADR